MNKLMPDYYFDKFTNASPEFLEDLGIKGVILDIDNTLEPYEHEFPGEHVVDWLNKLKEKGINACFVSNNNEKRVNTFNSDLRLPAFPNAKKPFSKNLKSAMSEMGSDKSNTIVIGDQIFTDVLAAKNTGIKAILVKPIKDKTDIFTKFKRLLEKPILKKYMKRKTK